MNDLPMYQRYALLRLDKGIGSREAARKAGYANGTPSAAAIDLYRACLQVKEMGELGATNRELLERQLEANEREAANLHKTLEAMEFLEGVA